jgi:hypothetical protein
LVALLYASSMTVANHWTGQSSDLFGVAIFGTVIGYAAAIVIGIPLYVLLRVCGRNDLGDYVLAGAVAGVLTFELMWPGGLHGLIWLAMRGHLRQGASLFLDSVELELPCAAAGSAAAIIFWCIERPDRNVRAQAANAPLGST